MNVAFIPLRGGSKSIPLKNILKINYRPLVYWVLDAAVACKQIDVVYVATDSQEIKQVVGEYPSTKIQVIGRSEESATDTASTESVMLEFANKYEFDNIVLIQATSPMLTAKDLDNGFYMYNFDKVDSVLSVVRQKRFIWEYKNGRATPINYEISNRPMRQVFDGYLVENGAFYITSKKALMESQCRISGNIKMCEMNEESYFEIDEPCDWIIVENFLKNSFDSKKQKDNSSIIPDIKMFLTDCDGCLTDGGMYYTENGDELKKFNTKDGLGLSLLKEKGIIVGIITGEDTAIVKRRAEKLSLHELHMGIKDKLSIAKKLCEKYGISMDNVAYVGDDVNDIKLLQSVGFGCSVNNALPIVKKNAKYISPNNGGEGAVREIIDLILSKYLN